MRGRKGIFMNRRNLARAAAILLALAVTLLSLTACSEEFLSDFLGELINELASSGRTDAQTVTGGEKQTGNAPSKTIVKETKPSAAFPLVSVPAIPDYKMPAENFADDLEKEAAGIIDGAIEKATAYVSVMKDDRHSTVSYPYEKDAGGEIAALSANQKKIYDLVTDAGRNWGTFKFTKNEFGEKYLEDALTVSTPMMIYDPDLVSYFEMNFLTYGSVTETYFDPYKDANYRVSNGKADMNAVKHDAELMYRVIKRIVRKMPEGLSTYDKYYYLAAVLSEQITYESAEKNSFTAFGALVCGKSVCEGYSGAYVLLCREANLWCAERHGIPEGGGHVWNVVKLDSGIYHVDVTWCDAAEPYRPRWYKYFMKSEEVFAKDHGLREGIVATGAFEPTPYESSEN